MLPLFSLPFFLYPSWLLNYICYLDIEPITLVFYKYSYRLLVILKWTTIQYFHIPRSLLQYEFDLNHIRGLQSMWAVIVYLFKTISCHLIFSAFDHQDKRLAIICLVTSKVTRTRRGSFKIKVYIKHSDQCFHFALMTLGCWSFNWYINPDWWISSTCSFIAVNNTVFDWFLPARQVLWQLHP